MGIGERSSLDVTCLSTVLKVFQLPWTFHASSDNIVVISDRKLDGMDLLPISCTQFCLQLGWCIPKTQSYDTLCNQASASDIVYQMLGFYDALSPYAWGHLIPFRNLLPFLAQLDPLPIQLKVQKLMAGRSSFMLKSVPGGL